MMISDSMRSEFKEKTRAIQVIVAAMPVGATFLGVVVCAMADWGL